MEIVAHPDWAGFGAHLAQEALGMTIVALIALWFYELTHQTEAARMSGGPPRFRRALIWRHAPWIVAVTITVAADFLFPGWYGLAASAATVIACAGLIAGLYLLLRRWPKWRLLMADFERAHRAPQSRPNWSRPT